MMANMSNPEVLLWAGLCVGFVFLSGLFSGSETGLYCLNRMRLRLAAYEKHRSAVRLQRLMLDEPGLLFTTLLGTNIANYLAPACLTVIFLGSISGHSAAQREHLAELYTTLILTPVVFIFGEVVPKNIFQRQADRFMLRISSLLAGAHRLFRATGIVAFQGRVSAFVMKRLHHQPVAGSALHSRLDMYQMLREGAAAGALSRTQVFMLERIHTLKSIRVGSVMVPWSATATISADASQAEIENTIRNTSVSRLPVHRADDRRRIVGIAHLLDLLTAEPGASVFAHVQPPVELPPDMPVIDALATLQRKHRRMAIAVDKWGHCVGIVTVKDLVEEIVGELAAW